VDRNVYCLVVRGEFEALRRVAHLASDYLELQTARLRDGVAETVVLDDLRTALEDLQERFPYLLGSPVGEELTRR
jgi:hypothetical protein